MEPPEIFELILRADDLLKYATEDKAAVRAGQARELLAQARREAAAIGNDQLVEQAERRLADLATMLGETPEG
jgi:threonine aldolase